MPLILFACMPPGQKARHMSEAHGSPLQIAPATEGPPLRGLLALLLRSIASSQEGTNFCASVKQEASRCRLKPLLQRGGKPGVIGHLTD